jgi:CDP-diacylglycerol--glycerol-3-phosphate 3-phosphatidyltransferase
MLAPFVSELDRIAPAVDLDASQITILETPDEFYETLKARIRHAKRRIFLSTLYIGKTEEELILTIRESMRASPSVRLHILTDKLRGTRESPNPSCASLLAPLVAEFGEKRVEIRMYHTPNLTGIKKQLVPRRINEGWGLQHMKLYGVDDETILTGANLSNDYFTNRQDRYHLFSSKDVTDYFFKIQQAVSSFSFLIKPSDAPAGYKATWPEMNSAPNPLHDPKSFVAHTTKAIHTLIAPPPPPSPASRGGTSAPKNTRVYLLTQTSQLLEPDTSTELPAMTHILRTLALPTYKDSSWVFTAGYFNPAPALTNLLLGTASSKATVITAHPAANGFYKSAGVSGMLPDAYTHLARRFLQGVHRAGRDAVVTLKEWRRGTVNQPDGWTYHAKGLWVTMPGDSDPSITLIGSSNYTKRSYSLDLEAGALVVTRDEGLKKRLGNEQRWLQEYATSATRDDLASHERRTGIKVRLAMWIVSVLGGAL